MVEDITQRHTPTDCQLKKGKEKVFLYANPNPNPKVGAQKYGPGSLDCFTMETERKCKDDTNSVVVSTKRNE